jgi:hypothetical protein
MNLTRSPVSMRMAIQLIGRHSIALRHDRLQATQEKGESPVLRFAFQMPLMYTGVHERQRSFCE